MSLSPPPKFKSGKLSAKEIAYIKANTSSQTVDQIAQHLMRRASVVQDFIERNSRDGIYVSETLETLRSSCEYALLKDELTEKEIKIFEKKYSEWVGQFQGDVLFSERNQISNIVKQEILMSKMMQQRKNIEETIGIIDDEINTLKDHGATDKVIQDRIKALRIQKGDLHGIYSSIISQHHEQNKLYASMQKDLKATRSSRVIKEDDKKGTILELMKMMENDNQRLNMGEEAELERLSAEEEGKKYTQLTEYLDGTQDFPFISGKN